MPPIQEIPRAMWRARRRQNVPKAAHKSRRIVVEKRGEVPGQQVVNKLGGIEKSGFQISNQRQSATLIRIHPRDASRAKLPPGILVPNFKLGWYVLQQIIRGTKQRRFQIGVVTKRKRQIVRRYADSFANRLLEQKGQNRKVEKSGERNGPGPIHAQKKGRQASEELACRPVRGKVKSNATNNSQMFRVRSPLFGL